MPREKFQTLTEQMFYILLCLKNECVGIDILNFVKEMTNGRVNIGCGTLYDLLEIFNKEGLIKQTKKEGRKRYYIITQKGIELLEKEYKRLCLQINDYKNFI